MLLEFNPGLAKYSTFHGLNFPLHFTSAKSHNEIMTLLLENGVDVNLRNYCGQSLGGGADSAHLQKHYMCNKNKLFEWPECPGLCIEGVERLDFLIELVWGRLDLLWN
ncbi:uncharacterized protein LOC122056250 isoform X4 [Zingiber officinale]|uniref:uncharacterized protein LOC122056250 isoform X4 n=1 Tax=Zingiber officinale TaxID=94328 RepID=UPI001C4B1DDE|nr:uncharacterized protein LOC122056250 isoform X4 [Zingiber officinale]